jgi:hypothetical protein
MSHKCDLPKLPEPGRFDQCSLCGQWYVGCESWDFMQSVRRRRRPRWWAETVLSHQERKSVRLNRRDDKKIARHQASKETTT